MLRSESILKEFGSCQSTAISLFLSLHSGNFVLVKSVCLFFSTFVIIV